MKTLAERSMVPGRALVGIFGGLFVGYAGLTSVIPVPAILVVGALAAAGAVAMARLIPQPDVQAAAR